MPLALFILYFRASLYIYRVITLSTTSPTKYLYIKFKRYIGVGRL
jgi:hypothetical protein